MTDTTTTTAQHWLLHKYSRSRSLLDTAGPPARPNPGEVAGQASDDHIQWDHYSQPQLALRLETTFASSSSSSSASSPLPLRMVLSVTFDPLFRDPARGGNQQPLLLDSLDLTSFSTPEIRAATPHDQLPLKAVYRDAVLGLRYLALSSSARSAPNQPQVEFRRLQAKFASTAERERFVDAIKALVPAKPAVEATAPAVPDAAPASEPAAKKKKPATPVKPVKPAKKAATPRTRKKPTAKTSPAAALPPAQDSYASAPAYSPPLASTSLRPPAPHTPTQRLPAGIVPSSASRLPAHLSTLLPHLATASTSTASQLLAQLPQGEFEQLLQDALLEEGFGELVGRVQGMLTGEAGGKG
ncbi:hypothetical protein JCM10449v2_005796 [Rhodotorula kratochvilovae]